MKKSILLAFAVILCLRGFSQKMHVKQPNFSSFHQDKKMVTPGLVKASSPEATLHPEYGIVPYNAQCSECVELIDKRTLDSRLFIDPKNAKHTYSQQSYFPLHYKKNEGDIWRTIDLRLRPDADNKGVYVAKDQPVPTKCDLNKKSTSLDLGELEFEFNKNLTLYFFDETSAYTKTESANYTDYTIGEEGLQVKNVWSGINMQQIFSTGEVKTNFVINAPLQLPLTKGWMVIEDHFSLPQGYTFEESEKGSHLKEGYYRGDYLLKNAQGKVLLTYEKPVYVDAKAYGMHGIYNLLRTGNNYTLQTLVPVEWLNKSDNTYPLFIDPIVFGQTKNGDFTSTGLPPANLAFTSMPLGSCDYHMSVTVPGKSTLQDAYLDLEYTLTYNSDCGTPNLPPPFCTFSQVKQEVICDTCHTSSGQVFCNPAYPPYTGTCTSDSNLFSVAHAIRINDSAPNFLSCIRPQCSDYHIAFTLKNTDSICGDQCGYLCATGNMWAMTVEACRVDGGITQSDTLACVGQPITFSALPGCGIPPYHYAWTTDGGNTFDTIYGTPDYTVHPQHDLTVWYIKYDSCGASSFYISDTLSVSLPTTPHITISGDTLISSVDSGNQWYLNDTVIPGATSKQWIITQAGNYTVTVTDSNECTSGASTPAIIAGINELGKVATFNIYPNPATNQLLLKTSNFNPQSISIYDAAGKKVFDEKYSSQINIHMLRAGTYFIEVKGSGIVMRKRFMKI